jgi:hypothetical protein
MLSKAVDLEGKREKDWQFVISTSEQIIKIIIPEL